MGIQLDIFYSIILGTRYLIFCVCIIWSNLCFAKNCATDFGMLARKMHHCNGPKIQKQFYLSKKRYKRNSAMCLVATLEKKEIKTFESVRHPNPVIVASRSKVIRYLRKAWPEPHVQVSLH